MLRFGFASVFSSISSCVYLVTCDNQYTWIVIECWILFERVDPSPPLRILAIIDNFLFNSWAPVNEVRKKKGRETVVVIKWPLGPWQCKTVLCVKSGWTEAWPICLYTARKNWLLGKKGETLRKGNEREVQRKATVSSIWRKLVCLTNIFV